MNEQEIAKFILEDLNYNKSTYSDFYACVYKLASCYDWNISNKETLRKEAKKLNIKLIIRKNEIVARFYD
jgi:methyltransferase-like protein